MVNEQVVDAQKSYHQELIERTLQAVARLLEEGKRVSFYSVAKRANIARSTLYRCEDLRALVVEGRKGMLGSHSPGDVCESPLEGKAEEQLRHVILERDILLQTLNAICEGGNPGPCHFALIAIEENAGYKQQGVA